ncbi:hypothetical protein A2U01_0016590, partial [Trifolium medium]|nr:hypothetical protein [Trifolium medium]
EATPCKPYPPPEPPDLPTPYPPPPESTESGQSATAFYRIALLPTPLVGVRAVEYVNEERQGNRRGVKEELQHISKYFNLMGQSQFSLGPIKIDYRELKQYYGLVDLIHDNSYGPIGLLDPNPQTECFSLIQYFVRALSSLQVLPASAVVSPHVKVERRCPLWVPSLIYTWFPLQITPITPLKLLKPTESWGGAYPFIKSSTSVLSACPDSLVLQDGKEMHECVVKTCDVRDKILATVLVDREYQEVGITSDCASILSICFVKLEVCAIDMKGSMELHHLQLDDGEFQFEGTK